MRPSLLTLLLLLCLLPLPLDAADADLSISFVPPAGACADGEPRTLNILLLDATGAPATGAKITWTQAQPGEISRWSNLGNGMWSTRYTSPVEDWVTRVDVVVDVESKGEVVTRHFSFDLEPGPEPATPEPPPPAAVVTAPVAPVEAPPAPVEPAPVEPAVVEPAVVEPPVAEAPAEAPTEEPAGDGAAALAEVLGLPEIRTCGFNPVDDLALSVKTFLDEIVSISDRIDAIPTTLGDVVAQSESCVQNPGDEPPPLPIRLDPLTFRITYDPDNVPECIEGLPEAVEHLSNETQTLPRDMANVPQQAMLMGQNVVAAGQSIPMELMSIGQQIAMESAAGRPVDALIEQQQSLKDAKQTLADLGLYLKEVPRYLKERKEYTVAYMDRLAGREPRERKKPGRTQRSTESAATAEPDRAAGRTTVESLVVGPLHEDLSFDNPQSSRAVALYMDACRNTDAEASITEYKQLVDRGYSPDLLATLSCHLPKRCSYKTFRAAILATERDYSGGDVPGCYDQPSDKSKRVIQSVIDARSAEIAAAEAASNPPQEPEPVEEPAAVESDEPRPDIYGLSNRDAAIHLFFTQCSITPTATTESAAHSHWDMLLKLNYTEERILKAAQRLSSDCDYVSFKSAIMAMSR